MTAIAYNVYCRIPNATQATSWLEWMRHDHIAKVIAAGAQSATLLKINEEQKPDDLKGDLYEVRYIFASRTVYDEYITNHAPRLRAEGAALFPPGADFIYSRNHAEIISLPDSEWPASQRSNEDISPPPRKII